MNRRARMALVGLMGVCAVLAAALGIGREPAPGKERTLPGYTVDGYTLLPNQWKIRPTGTQTELGDFPVHAELHPSGQWLAVLHAGYGEHEIVILELKGARPRITGRVRIDQTFYGICFAPDGKSLFASGGEFEIVHQFDFDKGLLSNHREIAAAEETEKFIPGGLTLDAQGKTLWVCGTFGDALVRLPLDRPADKVRIPMT